MNLLPGLKLRADEESEVLGMDDAEIGEFAVSLLSALQALFLIHCSMITSSLPATLSTAITLMI